MEQTSQNPYTESKSRDDAYRDAGFQFHELVFSVLRVAWQRRLVLLPTFFVSFCGFALVALLTVPSYTAVGAVQVGETGALGNTESLLGLTAGLRTSDPVQTELQLLRRRGFILRALKDLKLHLLPEEPSPDFTTNFDIIRGEASPTSADLTRIRSALSVLELDEKRLDDFSFVVEMDDEGNMYLVSATDRVQALQGEPLVFGPLRLTFDRLPTLENASSALKVSPDERLWEEFRNVITSSMRGSVREPTSIVSVAATHKDRQVARQIVDKIFELYISEALEWQSETASQTADFIRKQLEKFKDQLQEVESRYQQFTTEQDAIALDAQVEATIENLAALEAKRMDVELQSRTIASVARSLKRASRGGSASKQITSNFILGDAVLQEAVADLTRSEHALERLLAHLTTDHPKVVAQQRELARRRTDTLRLMQSARESLSQSSSEIRDEIESATAKMSDIPAKQIQLAQITRELEVTQSTYSLLLEKLEEAEIFRAATTIDKRIVEHPYLPSKPSTPDRSKIVGLGLILSVLVGLLAALARHLSISVIETLEEVQKETGLPVYGTIPRISVNVAEESKRSRLSVDQIWTSEDFLPHVEAFRSLAINIHLEPRQDRNRGLSISVTSSQPAEGKSTVLSNLGVALAKSGKKVLIVDLDLRKPVQHRIWNMARSPGFVDYLARTSNSRRLDTFESVKGPGPVPSSIENVHVLPAGTKIPDPTGAVVSGSLAESLEHWKTLYDYVLLDAPPSFVSETIAVADVADRTLLIARPGTLERKNLRGATRKLRTKDSNRIALVANDVTDKSVGRYGYYGGYGYAYYGEDESSSGTSTDS